MLARRLWIRAPLGYGGTWFQFKDESIQSYCNLIDFVLERYARRFGRVDNEKANILQDRLVDKYANGAWQTRKSLLSYSECGFIYPQIDRCEANLLIRMQGDAAQRIKDDLIKSYTRPDGNYSSLMGYRICNVCATHIYEEITTGGDVYMGRFSFNGWDVICKNKKCRALSGIVKGCNNRKEPLLKIIFDVTTHRGNNELRRKLEKHFVQNS